MTTTDLVITVIGTDGIVWTRCEDDHPEAVAHGVLGIARPADIDDVDLATGPDEGETLAACLIRLGRTAAVGTAIGDVLVVYPWSADMDRPDRVAARRKVAEWDAMGAARDAARAAGLPMPAGGIEMPHGWEPVHPEVYDETVALGWGGTPTPEPIREAAMTIASGLVVASYGGLNSPTLCRIVASDAVPAAFDGNVWVGPVAPQVVEADEFAHGVSDVVVDVCGAYVPGADDVAPRAILVPVMGAEWVATATSRRRMWLTSAGWMVEVPDRPGRLRYLITRDEAQRPAPERIYPATDEVAPAGCSGFADGELEVVHRGDDQSDD